MPDTTAPVFGDASARPDVFAVNPKGAAEKPVASAVKKGTTFRYAVSEAARVVFTIQRSVPGRKVNGKCVKKTRKNRDAKRCRRFVTKGKFAAIAVAGVNSHKFSGIIGKRTLAPGVYRAVLVATDAAGNASKRKLIRFKIVRP